MRKILSLSLLLLLGMGTVSVHAQSKQPIIWWNMTWNGLRVQQPVDEMPNGNAPFQQAVRKAKENRVAKFVPIDDNKWELTDGWELIEADKVRENSTPIFDPQLDTKNWYNAVVPGTILTSLVASGVYPDPYYGLNNLAITDTLCRMDWWYRIAFETPEQAKGKISKIQFNGINYVAEVYLNNKRIGTIGGAFIRGEFDMTPYLKASGKNVLAVRMLPPNNPGIPHEQSMVSGQGLNGGQLCLDGPTFISSEGWDWMPGIRDRNMGIWQDVRLVTYSQVALVDPLVITDLPLPDTTTADISIKTQVRNLGQQAASGVLKGNIVGTNIRFEKAFMLKADELQTISITPAEFAQLKMQNPQLWWPNGYGQPHLYQIRLTAEVGNQLSDVKEISFGIREFSYELMVAKEKQVFRRVEMNPLKALKSGKPIFDVVNRVEYKDKVKVPAMAAGADYGLLDELDQNDPVGPYIILKVNGVRIFAKGGNWGMDDAMKNTSRSKLEPYFKLHREENFNIIRNWTGESTDEMFYTLADEYGMLIWNDFWMTTEDSNTDPNDHNLFVRNAEDAVRRFRNHASIIIWCPRNEGFAPTELEQRLSAMCAKEDPTRMYHGQSRFLNMGDSGPWGFFPDFAYYYKERAKGFNTEMGCYSIPTANTIRKFIAPEDLWPINDVWAYHDLHHTSQGFNFFMKAIDSYGKPSGFEDFVKKAQMTNYDSWRAMLESWNSKMWDDCTGLILWMSHPAWPSMIWQTYSWDYETHAAFFGSKKASEPLHIQLNLHDNKVIVVNASNRNADNLTATLYYYDLKGKLLHKQTAKAQAAANKKVDCFVADTDLTLPDLYLARLELKKGNAAVSINDYWKHGKQNTAKDNQAFNASGNVKLSASRSSDKTGKTMLEIKNNTSEIAVAIKLNVKNDKTGEIVLPAYFSEGYFNLLPKERKMVALELPTGVSLDGCSIVAEGYNSQSHVLVK